MGGILVKTAGLASGLFRCGYRWTKALRGRADGVPP
jgi:hypothetical protein